MAVHVLFACGPFANRHQRMLQPDPQSPNVYKPHQFHVKHATDRCTLVKCILMHLSTMTATASAGMPVCLYVNALAECGHSSAALGSTGPVNSHCTCILLAICS